MLRNGGQAAAELLADYGVRYVFGVPGGQTLSFYDGLSKLSPKIQHVLVRDEKTGPFMADGYSRITFSPGVCDGTAGPGAANMLPSVIEAYTSSSPVIAITSDIVTKWMGRGASQELDHYALFHSFVKASLRPKRTLDIPYVLREAFRIATTDRPGPVHVDFPQDILEGSETTEESFDLKTELQYAKIPGVRTSANPRDIAKIVDLLSKAERPIILAGGGAILSQAWDEVTTLATKIGAPVVTTLTGKGIIPESHPLSLGCVGRQGYRPTANKALREADLILAFGTKFAQVGTSNWTLIDEGKTQIININFSAPESLKIYKSQIPVVADVKESIKQIMLGLSAKSAKGTVPSASWIGYVSVLKNEWASMFEQKSQDDSEPLKPAFIFKEIRKSLPEKSVLVSSGSFSGAFAGCYFDVRHMGGRRFVQARGMAGTEGALPLAIGVSLGIADDSRVLAVTGDGGFGYHISELETANRMNLSFPIVILNNNSLGWMRILQKEHFGSNYTSTAYQQELNYSNISRAFGCKALRVEKGSEVPTAISDAIHSSEMFVLEMMTDPCNCDSTHMKSDGLAAAEGMLLY